jgi:hypothetical protein
VSVISKAMMKKKKKKGRVKVEQRFLLSKKKSKLWPGQKSRSTRGKLIYWGTRGYSIVLPDGGRGYLLKRFKVGLALLPGVGLLLLDSSTGTTAE